MQGNKHHPHWENTQGGYVLSTAAAVSCAGFGAGFGVLTNGNGVAMQPATRAPPRLDSGYVAPEAVGVNVRGCMMRRQQPSLANHDPPTLAPAQLAALELFGGLKKQAAGLRDFNHSPPQGSSNYQMPG